MPAKPPAEGYSRTMSVILVIVAVIAAVNLGARNIAGFTSEVLVLGLPDAEGEVILLAAERDVPLGGRVY